MHPFLSDVKPTGYLILASPGGVTLDVQGYGKGDDVVAPPCTCFFSYMQLAPGFKYRYELLALNCCPELFALLILSVQLHRDGSFGRARRGHPQPGERPCASREGAVPP